MQQKSDKKILYIDMDNVLVDFESGVEQLRPTLKLEYEGRLDEVPGIFSLMNPVEGAIEAYRRLIRHYDVYILSTAPWHNPGAWSDKVKWVQQYLGTEAYKRLILTHHKELNRGDYLIDDRINNGAGEFQGEFLHFGKHYLDWDAVLAYLIPKHSSE